jgi:hypothetical protein
MSDSESSKPWTPEYVWTHVLDQEMLCYLLGQIAERLDPDTVRGKSIERFKGSGEGDILPDSPEATQQELRRVEDWAEKQFEAALAVWDKQRLKPCSVLYQSLQKYLLIPFVRGRRRRVRAQIKKEQLRSNEPGKTTRELEKLDRALTKLKSKWEGKLKFLVKEALYADEEARREKAHNRQSADFAGIKEYLSRIRVDFPPVTPFTLPSYYAPSAAMGEIPQIGYPQSEGRRTVRPGPAEKLKPEFVTFAAALWNGSKSVSGRVSPENLLRIAGELDAAQYGPPAKYLEEQSAKELRTSNSKNAHSKVGPLLMWVPLVKHGDKNQVRAMRKLLSRCAGKCP